MSNKSEGGVRGRQQTHLTYRNFWLPVGLVSRYSRQGSPPRNCSVHCERPATRGQCFLLPPFCLRGDPSATARRWRVPRPSFAWAGIFNEQTNPHPNVAKNATLEWGTRLPRERRFSTYEYFKWTAACGCRPSRRLLRRPPASRRRASILRRGRARLARCRRSLRGGASTSC